MLGMQAAIGSPDWVDAHIGTLIYAVLIVSLSLLALGLVWAHQERKKEARGERQHQDESDRR